MRPERKSFLMRIYKFMINIITFCILGMVEFKIFFLLEIKILCLPVEVLIPFQSPPRRPYEVDVTPYITYSLLPIQNMWVVIPNFVSFFTFLFLIWHFLNTTSCHLLDYSCTPGLATSWTAVVSAFCYIIYLSQPNNSKPHAL